jgi:hypothetical protein
MEEKGIRNRHRENAVEKKRGGKKQRRGCKSVREIE